MSKDSIAKYHQNNKERVQKKACEKYQSIFEDKKKKRDNMVLNDTKIYQKMENKSLLSKKRL